MEAMVMLLTDWKIEDGPWWRKQEIRHKKKSSRVLVVVEGGSDGGEGREQEVGNEEKGRATEKNPRATVPTGAVGSILESEGSGTAAKGLPIVGESSGGGDNSGAVGNVRGLNGSPPRDPARGKSAVIAEEEEPAEKEQTTEAAPNEIREEYIAFRPPVTAATSSRHVPITKDDIAEQLPDDMLARLLEEHPDIGEMVLKAKEERARAIAAWEAAEKAERERKDREDLLQDMEAEERAAEEAQGPRVKVVAEAAAMRRPDYAAETYTPPTLHLLIPSGFSAYTPQRSEYEDEMVLRDPQIHIANTWAEGNPAAIHLVLARVEPPPVTVLVPTEWVNEAIRRMLALEKLVRRAAGGFPLELRYPESSPLRAQRAATMKTQKKLAARTTAPPAASQRQTRSSQAVAASKEVARQAGASAEEQFRIVVRKRPSSEEQRAQKRPKLVLFPTSEDEEEDDGEEEEDEEEGEEEEEQSSARSDSDDSVDDPAYKEDPKERADDSDDDGDDDGGNMGLKDWLRGEN
ncbi:hypothetical protein RHMOL_Rhmol02G0193800 [Rhododendron molle]|uniref:Uncharacterized protein n=1 Tax=Rhododendron molle TaxID=49168 RepID=A0ACC0PRZ4_RHOML|nr:hypothetical protein RHMOL_Rhmol02G0193800 [Rhododendron molle]